MTNPREEKSSDAVGIMRSPRDLAVLVLGVLFVFGAVFYLATRAFPGLFDNGIPNPITGENAESKGDPNAGMDFGEINTLPDDFYSEAAAILSREEPQMPDPLFDLTDPGGLGLIHPVNESVETPQVTLTWMLFAPGPFKVSVKDQAGQVAASAENVPRTIFVTPRLNPGATYTWEVTASNGEVESAQFVVLTAEQAAGWQQVRSRFSQSHLAVGVVAEQLGLLTIAEREYQELSRQFPNAEAPARLLANVQALRE